MTAKQYKEQNKHLPDFLQDFHDQKDVFKAFHDWASRGDAFQKMPNTWVVNHALFMDYFLVFMAYHGYKLQKIKAKDVDFIDIEQTIKEQRDYEAKQFKSLFENRLKQK